MKLSFHGYKCFSEIHWHYQMYIFFLWFLGILHATVNYLISFQKELQLPELFWCNSPTFTSYTICHFLSFPARHDNNHINSACQITQQPNYFLNNKISWIYSIQRLVPLFIRLTVIHQNFPALWHGLIKTILYWNLFVKEPSFFMLSLLNWRWCRIFDLLSLCMYIYI